MERPDKKLETDLKKIGVFIQERREEIPKNANYLSVHVEIGFPSDTEIGVPDFDVMILNERGIKTWCSAFRIIARGDQKIFSFEAYQEAPDNVPLSGNYSKLYYTSYIDLCWKLGNNKIDESIIPPVVTEPKEGAQHIDLGWVLPSRFVDSITNALGVLNTTILSNTMIEALVYGPFYSLKEESNEKNA